MKSPRGIFIIIIIISSCPPPLPPSSSFYESNFCLLLFPWKPQDCVTALRPGLFRMTRFSLQGKPRKLILCRERNSLTFTCLFSWGGASSPSLSFLFLPKNQMRIFWLLYVGFGISHCPDGTKLFVFFFFFSRLSRTGFACPILIDRRFLELIVGSWFRESELYASWWSCLKYIDDVTHWKTLCCKL